MNRFLTYKDDLTIYETDQDGYGDFSILKEVPVKGLFLQGTSSSFQSDTESIATDAHVYLDIENDFIKQNAFRLEGLFIKCNTLNGLDNESWYRIVSAKVGQRKLLDNELNNVHCRLVKVEALK
jgi:hypothetical protein|nr:MAG TPA: hypothetical protein [Caudoviricetes sp.]